jgi:hypothetical protein
MAAARDRTPRPGTGPVRAVTRPARAVTRSVGRSARRVGRAAGWASERVRRVVGQAASASLATTDPAGHPPPTGARSGGTARTGPAVASTRTRRPTVRRPRSGRSGPGLPVLVVAAVMVLIVGMLGFQQITGISVLPEQLTAGIRPPPKTFPVLPASPPVAISVPAVEVTAPVHQVGIAPDGSIGVPDAARAQEAGWYDQSPTPGQYGPAVIVGHVDTTTGPAVFHDLKDVRAGDRVEVTRQDRSVAVFEVNGVDRYDKEKLPVDEVYGDFSRPNLRLITCGGRWVGGATGYADNVVVFASLVRARDG